MHKLLQRQIARATDASDQVDLARLTDSVNAAYEEADRARLRTDRSISLMAEELESAHTRLLDAFDVVPEGLVLLDAEGRYVRFNQKFREIYTLVSDKIFVGGSSVDAMHAGVERGQYLDAIGREEAWMKERISGELLETNSGEQRLAGGRWIRFEERLTADGGRIGVRIDITEHKRREAELERLAYFDPLTGLANRALFKRELTSVLKQDVKSKTQAALLFLDLDQFKEVNDSLGHVSGDELLTKVGERMSRVLDNKHFIARLGGDEFAIVVKDCTDKKAIQKLGKELLASVSGSIRLQTGDANIGTSIGVALIPQDGINLTDLQRNADLALYQAKDRGRGCMVFFESDMNDVAQHKIALARELRLAITQNRGLSVHFQPQVALDQLQITGFEALARWTHPTLGQISPAEFIPIAESSQLICDLGLWVLRQATKQAKAWIDNGETPRQIAVNVSAAQIWDSDFAADVAQVLEETGLPAHLLCLELTESLLVDHTDDRVRCVLTKLKQMGVSLALDDFGTNYSSLGYLTQLPFDKLKIDRMFVSGIDQSPRALRLLEGIIALGRGLGMTIVAEGAETEEEVGVLIELNCDLVQGFAFARPQPASQAMALAKSFDPARKKPKQRALKKSKVA